MRYILSSIVLLFCTLVHSQDYLEQDLKQAYKLLKSDLDSAAGVANKILDYSKREQNLYGQVKANYILGYISKAKKDFGVSVLYYLEAIRHSEVADYSEIEKDKVSLRKNLGNTFRNFRANALATKYYTEAIEIAKEDNQLKQQISMMLNLGLVYQDNQEYNLALNTFNDLLKIAGTSYKYRALNQIGLIYLETNDHNRAKSHFEELLDITPEDHDLHAKALHNLGEIKFHQGDIESSIEYLFEAVSIFDSSNTTKKYGVFNSLRTLGTYLFYNGQYEEAEHYLLESIKLIDHAKNDPKSFEVYKTLSDLYYSLDDKENGKKYQEEYFNISQEYINLQQDIQQKDKEYNFELITKRYFDDVKRQDRIASIMMYSKFSTGGLILLLILVVVYFRNDKKKLRRGIEEELRMLKVLD